MIERKNGILLPDDTKGHISVAIELDFELLASLTDGEFDRLEPKLLMVQRVAQHLAAGMVKGTTKYKTDTWTVREWLNYLKDDAVDVANYAFLLEAAMDDLANRTHDTAFASEIKDERRYGY